MTKKSPPAGSAYDFAKIQDLLRQNKTDEAAIVSGECIKKYPGDYSALVNHATVMLAALNTREAVEFAVQAFQSDESKSRPYIIIARALILDEDFLEAQKYASTANEKWPDLGEAQMLLGLTFTRLKHYFDAEAWLKKSLDNGDLTSYQKAEAEFHLGLALSAIEGRGKEALHHSQLAIKYDPQNAIYHMGIGNIYAAQNKPKAAQDAFDKALRIAPLLGAIYWNKSRSKKFTSDDRKFISRMQDLYVHATMGDADRVLLGFSLAKVYRDLGEYEISVDFWNTANAVQRRKNNFHISLEKIRFSNYYRDFPFTNEFMLRDVDSNAKKPIFILGMPRSGTTLTEQIIGSHSLVTPLGELEYIAAIAKMAVNKYGTLKSSEALSFVREIYLAEIDKHGIDTPYFTDKMPLNFRFIPVIANAFPDAKIIHCNRDPMAVCFSNFSNYFPAKGMTFTCGQKEIAEYHNMYTDYMELVSRSFPESIYQLDYKALTESQEIETNKLLKSCGLSLEDSCLNFQNNKRTISTASQRQVRKGMYTGSTEAWKKFGPWLGPMIDTLKHTSGS